MDRTLSKLDIRHLIWLGKNQRKVLEFMEIGKTYTTREIMDEFFKGNYRSNTLERSVFMSLYRLEIRGVVESELIDQERTRSRCYYTEGIKPRKIRIWHIKRLTKGHKGHLGCNQERIMENMEIGRRYTTRGIIDEIFPDLYRSDSLYSIIYSALRGLKGKNLIKSRMIETPYARYRSYYKTSRSKKKVWLWWIET